MSADHRDRPAGAEPAVADGEGLDGAGPGGPSALDLAREALAQAKADARRRGATPAPASGGRGTSRSRGDGRPGKRDALDDPRPLGEVIGGLLADQGWEQRAAVGGVFGRWAEIVGPEVAEHTRPESFEDGEVSVVADSAAWATQVRLLSATLVRRLNEELGHGSVRRVKVHGPGVSRAWPPRQR